MTTAKLVTAPPQGSGLIGQLVDKHYTDLVTGKPGEHLVATCVLQPVGTSSRRTKDGIHTAVTYEVVRLEVMHDSHDADQVTWLTTRAHDQRHAGTEQTALPFDSPSELRESTLAAIKEWAAEQDLDAASVDDRWLSYFGGSEHAAAAVVEHGSLVQLREFAFHVGALADDRDVEKALADAHADPLDEDLDPDEAADSPDEDDDEPVVPAPGFSA